uniref:Uncharacterized protein n=1 Tax=Rhizophora mucronata TaxID=61149 RepID=A0A2P2NCA2_RHIMU
MEARHTNTKK